MCRTLLAASLLLMATISLAQPPGSPAGRWKTIDDATGHAKAIVTLSEQNGVLSGTIEQVIESDQGPNPLCLKCEGELKNKPLTGLRFLWEMRPNSVPPSAANPNTTQWSGGQILDPKSGKVYRCTLTLADGGQTLKVRGYLGTPMLGRTQVWQRLK